MPPRKKDTKAQEGVDEPRGKKLATKIGSTKNVDKALKAQKADEKKKKQKETEGKDEDEEDDNNEEQTEEKAMAEKPQNRLTALQKKSNAIDQFQGIVNLTDVSKEGMNQINEVLQTHCLGYGLYSILHDTACGDYPELQHYKRNPRVPTAQAIAKLGESMDQGRNILNKDPTTAIILLVDPSTIEEGCIGFDWSNLKRIVFKEEWRGKLAKDCTPEELERLPEVGNGGHRTQYYRVHHAAHISIYVTRQAVVDAYKQKGHSDTSKQLFDAEAARDNAKIKVNEQVWAVKVYNKESNRSQTKWTVSLDKDELSRVLYLTIGANNALHNVEETANNVLGMAFDYINSLDSDHPPSPKDFEKAVNILVNTASSSLSGSIRRVLSDQLNAVALRRAYMNPIFRQSMPFSLTLLINWRGVLSIMSAPLIQFMCVTLELLTSNHALAQLPAYSTDPDVVKAANQQFERFFILPYKEKGCRVEIFGASLHDMFNDGDKIFAEYIHLFGVLRDHTSRDFQKEYTGHYNRYKETVYGSAKDLIKNSRPNHQDDPEALKIIDSFMEKLKWLLNGQIGGPQFLPQWYTARPIITPTTTILIVSQLNRFKHILVQVASWIDPLAYKKLGPQKKKDVFEADTLFSVLRGHIRDVQADSPVHVLKTINEFIALIYSHRFAGLLSIYEHHQETHSNPKKLTVPHFDQLHASRPKDDPVLQTINAVGKYLGAYIDQKKAGNADDKYTQKKGLARRALYDVEEPIDVDLLDQAIFHCSSYIMSRPDLAVGVPSRTLNLRIMAKFLTDSVWAAHYEKSDKENQDGGYDRAILENIFIRLLLHDIGNISLDAKDKEGKDIYPFLTWYRMKPITIHVMSLTQRIRRMILTNTTFRTVDIIVDEANQLISNVLKLFTKSSLVMVAVPDEDEDNEEVVETQPATKGDDEEEQPTKLVLKHDFHRLFIDFQSKIVEEVYNSCKHVCQNEYDFREPITKENKLYIDSHLDLYPTTIPPRESYVDTESWYSPANMAIYANPNATTKEILDSQKAYRRTRTSMLKKSTKGQKRLIPLSMKKLKLAIEGVEEEISDPDRIFSDSDKTDPSGEGKEEDDEEEEEEGRFARPVISADVVETSDEEVEEQITRGTKLELQEDREDEEEEGRSNQDMSDEDQPPAGIDQQAEREMNLENILATTPPHVPAATSMSEDEQQLWDTFPEEEAPARPLTPTQVILRPNTIVHDKTIASPGAGDKRTSITRDRAESWVKGDGPSETKKAKPAKGPFQFPPQAYLYKRDLRSFDQETQEID
ncbi:hypothetical protein H0H93_014661 [Arthromyces matolae]|nr:hypothetical protein H0H93_014661 [Arthromyces matolae]